jgi:cytoskeletal protein RodZ
MSTQQKVFKDLKTLGSFLQENRRIQNIKLSQASKTLLIKEEILKSFETGEINLESNSHLKGFLNTYVKYLKLDNSCKLEVSDRKKFSSLKKSNVQLESSDTKKNKYGSIIILLSLFAISLIYLFWNKKTYLNLYLIGSYLD